MPSSICTPNSTAVSDASTKPVTPHTTPETAFTLSLLNLGTHLNSFGQSAPAAATEMQVASEEELAIVRR